jgi:hypothetical protein
MTLYGDTVIRYNLLIITFFDYVGKILDFSNADVAVDHYHRFEVFNFGNEYYISASR